MVLCKKGYPLFGFLLFINLLGAGAALFIGWWLIDNSYEPFLHNLYLEEVDGGTNQSQEDEEDESQGLTSIASAMYIIGVITIIVAIFSFVWNVVDILLLLIPCVDNETGRPALGTLHDTLRTQLADVKPIGKPDTPTKGRV